MTGVDVGVIGVIEENRETYILLRTTSLVSAANITRAPSNNAKLSLVVSEATSDESDADAKDAPLDHSTVIVRVVVPVMLVM